MGYLPKTRCHPVSPRRRLVRLMFGDGPEHITIGLLFVIIVVGEYPSHHELENTGTLDSWF